MIYIELTEFIYYIYFLRAFRSITPEMTRLVPATTVQRTSAGITRSPAPAQSPSSWISLTR